MLWSTGLDLENDAAAANCGYEHKSGWQAANALLSSACLPKAPDRVTIASPPKQMQLEPSHQYTLKQQQKEK